MSATQENIDRLERDLGTKYGIFIVTKGRVQTLRTYEETLPEFLQDRVTIVCPPEEVAAHVTRGRNAHGFEHSNVWQSYAYIIHSLAPSMGLEKVIIMDDDVKFFRRIDDTAWNLRKFEDDGLDFYDMFARMDDLCDDDSPMVGVHARQMSNTKFPLTVEFACRQTMIHMINVQTFIDLGIRHDVMTFKGDFYATLSVLASGRTNKVLVDFTLDQYGASNAPGGVSNYRTFEGLEASAHQLKELFPDYISLQRKKNVWPGFPMPHLDVRVSWKECWKDGHFKRFGEWPEDYARAEKSTPVSIFSDAPKPAGFL